MGYDYFDDHDFDDCPEADDEEFDCHLGPDGYCGAAGTEWCEFDCPNRQ